MLKLLNYTQEELAGYIKKNQRTLYIYGAGMIGQVVIPDFIARYGLEDNVGFYIDSDEKKQEIEIALKNKSVSVCPVSCLKEVDNKSVIIITNSNYSSVLEMLDSMECLNYVEAAIFPIMQALEVEHGANREQQMLEDYSAERIPKVIHYCWFSGREIPDYLKKCMESWQEKCPDYEIRRWDESNYDISKNRYMKQAYEAGKWGFVPDYARLDILYHHGGFYLDTDVELLRSLDTLRTQGAFCGVEKWGNINMGGCSGAVKHHPMLKRMLEYRENAVFRYADGSWNPATCGVYETIPFIQSGMRVDNSIWRINDMTVFSSDFFHPYDYMSGKTVLTENTYSVHHFNGGWLNKDRMEERKKTTQLYQEILERMGAGTNEGESK